MQVRFLQENKCFLNKDIIMVNGKFPKNFTKLKISDKGYKKGNYSIYLIDGTMGIFMVNKECALSLASVVYTSSDDILYEHFLLIVPKNDFGRKSYPVAPINHAKLSYIEGKEEKWFKRLSVEAMEQATEFFKTVSDEDGYDELYRRASQFFRG